MKKFRHQRASTNPPDEATFNLAQQFQKNDNGVKGSFVGGNFAAILAMYIFGNENAATCL